MSVWDKVKYDFIKRKNLLRYSRCSEPGGAFNVVSELNHIGGGNNNQPNIHLKLLGHLYAHKNDVLHQNCTDVGTYQYTQILEHMFKNRFKLDSEITVLNKVKDLNTVFLLDYIIPNLEYYKNFYQKNGFYPSIKGDKKTRFIFNIYLQFEFRNPEDKLFVLDEPLQVAVQADLLRWTLVEDKSMPRVPYRLIMYDVDLNILQIVRAINSFSFSEQVDRENEYKKRINYNVGLEDYPQGF